MAKVKLESSPIPHYPIGGPPCPQWAGTGGHCSTGVARADVYETFLRRIKHCADSSEAYIGFALENVGVGGINQDAYNGLSFFGDVVVSHMRKELGDKFVVETHRTSLTNYCLPQSRNMV